MSRSGPARDIAFLGGMANYILQHDAWFREYVEHYTNGPVIIKDEFQDTEDTAASSRAGTLTTAPTDRHAGATTRPRARPPPASTSRWPTSRQPGPRRPRDEARRRRAARPTTTRCSTRIASSRSCRRHFAAIPRRRWLRSAAAPPRTSWRWPRRCVRTRAGADLGASSTRWAGPNTPSACRTSAPARSCSCCWATSAGRRGNSGAARPRQHPGLDRHPDAVRHPAGLYPMPHPQAHPTLDEFVELNGPDTGRGGT